MMSISSLSSSKDASSYYEVDDYYTAENSEEHTKLSEWVGKGAELQGLSGSVKPEDFTRVLDGIAPDGSAIGRIIDNERQHRPGIDLTFTPPKSVAIMAQVFGDKRIIEWHRESVKETLAMIEAFAAKTRVGQNGTMVEQNTGNLTIATFYHTSTRAQDPGFHTHAVIANMTLGQDGKWRSVHNDDIWTNSKARYGENYSMRMAEKLADGGYGIVAKGKNAEYEIGGVSQELIDMFSTRGRAIKDLLEERGLSGPKNKEWAALQTREKKVPMDKELEEATWKERAEAKGYDLSYLIAEAKHNEKQIGDHHKLGFAVEGVKDAVNHLSQRTSAFTIQEVVQTSRNLLVGQVSDKHIHKAIGALKEQEFLLHPDETSKMLTTREVVATENDNMLRVEFGKNIFSPIATLSEANKVARMHGLNEGQSNSLIMAATSRDRVNQIQGWAGVGKTHYGKSLNELLTNKNYEVIGLSPSAQAANELEKGSGIKSNTMASFIFKYRDRLDDTKANELQVESAKNILSGEEKRKFIVVDEASFVSSQDFNKLLRIAETFDARILKVGDYKQLGAVDAGAPHKQLLDRGITSEKMDEIIRQKDAPELRDAVYAAIANKPELAMQGIKVIENEKCQKLHEEERPNTDAMRAELAVEAAKTYSQLSAMERAKTALVVQNNDIRNQVNSLVRHELLNKGEISNESITVSSLKNVGLTDSQLKYAQNYQHGYVVRFNTGSGHFGVKANDYYTVLNNKVLIGKDRYISLVSENDPNKEIIVHPKELASRGERAIEIFERSDRNIAAGDTIRWNRNDKERGIINAQSALVTSIDQQEKTATLYFQNGETSTLPMNEFRNNHLDYNYANTAHSVQGGTFDRVITVVESWHKLLTNMKSFYVGISRGKYEAILITDSKDKTIDALYNNVERDDIALTLYERDQQPVDFDMITSIKEQLQDSVSVRDIYIDLVIALDGDRFAAQRHLQELGIDCSRLEQDLSVENAVRELLNEGADLGGGKLDGVEQIERGDYSMDNDTTNSDQQKTSPRSSQEPEWLANQDDAERETLGNDESLDDDNNKQTTNRREIDFDL
ncbi:TPA: conjugative relaxase [Vibrio vulnificus]|nr:conjugative relaxase [Vibrio vulnificus]